MEVVSLLKPHNDVAAVFQIVQCIFVGQSGTLTLYQLTAVSSHSFDVGFFAQKP